MDKENEDVGMIIENDFRVQQLKRALPNYNFVAKKIGGFIILYHNVIYRKLTKEEQNTFLLAMRSIKKIEPNNITMIYDKELDNRRE